MGNALARTNAELISGILSIRPFEGIPHRLAYDEADVQRA
jgi:hypothetical protein